MSEALRQDVPEPIRGLEIQTKLYLHAFKEGNIVEATAQALKTTTLELAQVFGRKDKLTINETRFLKLAAALESQTDSTDIITTIRGKSLSASLIPAERMFLNWYLQQVTRVRSISQRSVPQLALELVQRTEMEQHQIKTDEKKITGSYLQNALSALLLYKGQEEIINSVRELVAFSELFGQIYFDPPTIANKFLDKVFNAEMKGVLGATIGAFAAQKQIEDIFGRKVRMQLPGTFEDTELGIDLFFIDDLNNRILGCYSAKSVTSGALAEQSEIPYVLTTNNTNPGFVDVSNNPIPYYAGTTSGFVMDGQMMVVKTEQVPDVYPEGHPLASDQQYIGPNQKIMRDPVTNKLLFYTNTPFMVERTRKLQDGTVITEKKPLVSGSGKPMKIIQRAPRLVEYYAVPCHVPTHKNDQSNWAKGREGIYHPQFEFHTTHTMDGLKDDIVTVSNKIDIAPKFLGPADWGLSRSLTQLKKRVDHAVASEYITDLDSLFDPEVALFLGVASLDSINRWIDEDAKAKKRTLTVLDRIEEQIRYYCIWRDHPEHA